MKLAFWEPTDLMCYPDLAQFVAMNLANPPRGSVWTLDALLASLPAKAAEIAWEGGTLRRVKMPSAWSTGRVLSACGCEPWGTNGGVLWIARGHVAARARGAQFWLWRNHRTALGYPVEDEPRALNRTRLVRGAWKSWGSEIPRDPPPRDPARPGGLARAYLGEFQPVTYLDMPDWL